MNAPNPPAISFHNLTLGYGRHKVIQNLNATIPRGALLAVAGANGSGKSTLFKTLAGELRPLGGSFRLHGFGARDLAYLPQRLTLEQNFPLNVQDCVAMGLWQQIGAFGAVSLIQQHRIESALAAVGLADRRYAPLSSLSGGQMQRILFARLLLQDAPVILLDEPFNAVDEQTIGALLALVRHWHQQGRTVLAVLHDWQRVSSHFPDVLWLENSTGFLAKTTERFRPRPARQVA